MKKINLDQFEIFSPRIDWITVVGNTPMIIRERDFQAIDEIMIAMGFEFLMFDKALKYRSRLLGIQILFKLNRGSSMPQIAIEFQGQFFAQEMPIAEKIIRKLVKQLWEVFGIETPPKVTRVDIAQDIKNAKQEDLFPDFSEDRYYINTNSKNKPKIKHNKYYSDPNNQSKQTGIDIKNARFEFSLYQRMEKLDQYAKNPDKAIYVEYYRELYKSKECESVLRVETRIKAENCNYFSIAFFKEKQSLEQLTYKALAHFNKHHRIFDKQTNMPLEHIDRLYFSEQYESIKTMGLRINHDLDVRKLQYGNSYLDYNASTTNIAKVLINNRLTDKNNIMEVMFTIIKKIREESKQVLAYQENHLKTAELFELDILRQRDIRDKFLRFSSELKQIIEEYPTNYREQSQFLNIIPFIKKIENYHEEVLGMMNLKEGKSNLIQHIDNIENSKNYWLTMSDEKLKESIQNNTVTNKLETKLFKLIYCDKFKGSELKKEFFEEMLINFLHTLYIYSKDMKANPETTELIYRKWTARRNILIMNLFLMGKNSNQDQETKTDFFNYISKLKDNVINKKLKQQHLKEPQGYPEMVSQVESFKKNYSLVIAVHNENKEDAKDYEYTFETAKADFSIFEGLSSEITNTLIRYVSRMNEKTILEIKNGDKRKTSKMIEVLGETIRRNYLKYYFYKDAKGKEGQLGIPLNRIKKIEEDLFIEELHYKTKNNIITGIESEILYMQKYNISKKDYYNLE